MARVILAEDDAEMRSLLALALRRDGFEVVEVKDGRELHAAVVANEDADVDVVVSDVRMPGGSGLDVLVALRQKQRGTPVVLITGFGDRDVHDRAGQLGAVVLDKPFEVARLRETVRKLVPQARS